VDLPTPPNRPDASTLLPLLSAGSPDALAGTIRGILIQSMPNPLYENWPNWGNTSRVARGVKWKGITPELIYIPKNDGKWRHLKVTADNPAQSLVFDIREMQQPELGRMTFTVFLAFDANLVYDQQNWEGGIKLYDGSARARFHVKATLSCEAIFRVESGSLLLPEAVLRLHVVHADVGYDRFVMEHVAGVGGEAAKILGDAIKGGMHKWHPSLEHDLLAKANKAIEKAADTKEVRVSVFELLKKKGWLGARTPTPSPAPAPSAR